MKKTLIALAVLGFAGAAMAQSSVTLYGVADAGYSRTQTVKVNPDGTTSKVSTNGMSSGSLMNNGNSRLGVRGVEDMGGGLKAGFNLEDGLSLNDGHAGLSSDTHAFWGRQANLWLGGQWGQFIMGRQFNPSYDTLAAWELTGQANYSVVGNTYNYTGEGPRTSSQFKYVTPNFSGFKAEASFVPRDNNLIDGQPANAWDLGATYTNGPIAVGASANKASRQKTNYEIGGKYTFANVGGGSLALAASYNSFNNLYGNPTFSTGGTVTEAVGRRRGFSLGGSYMTGPFTLTLDVTRDTKNELSLNDKKYTNELLEGKYALSKRTFLYAAYLHLDSTNNFGVGLRHNF